MTTQTSFAGPALMMGRERFYPACVMTGQAVLAALRRVGHVGSRRQSVCPHIMTHDTGDASSALVIGRDRFHFARVVARQTVRAIFCGMWYRRDRPGRDIVTHSAGHIGPPGVVGW